jgi:hypothetical protein
MGLREWLIPGLRAIQSHSIHTQCTSRCGPIPTPQKLRITVKICSSHRLAEDFPTRRGRPRASSLILRMDPDLSIRRAWNGKGTRNEFHDVESPMVPSDYRLHRHTFAGTNGWTGFSTCTVRCLDRIFVFGDSGNARGALILRRTSESSWLAAGAALTHKQEISTQSSGGLRTTFSGSFISEMDDLRNDWLEDLYLLAHPYHLRHLFLSGLIGDASAPVSKSRKRKDFKNVDCLYEHTTSLLATFEHRTLFGPLLRKLIRNES